MTLGQRFVILLLHTNLTRSFAVSAVLLGGTLLVSGAPATPSVLITLLLSLSVATFGATWAWARGRTIWLVEWLGMGIAGTFVIPALVHISLAAPFLPDLPRWVGAASWLVGPALALVMLARSGPRAVLLAVTPERWWALGGASAAYLAPVVLNRWQFTRYPLSGTTDYTSFHPDMFFFQLLTTANSHWPVGQVGVMSDWPARYHWLGYGWAGSLESVLGLAPFVAITRALPFLAILGLSVLPAAIVSHRSARRWLPAVAALLVTVGRLPLDSTGLGVNWDSPSQTASTALLLAGMLIVTLLATGLRRGPLLVAAALLGFAITGFKTSAAIDLLAGLGVVVLLGLLGRGRPRWRTSDWWKPSWTLLAVSAVASAAAGVILIRGSGSGDLVSVRWAGATSLMAILTGTAAAAVTTLTLAPSLVGLTAGRLRRDPLLGFSLGCLAAGLLAMWLLAEAGPNTRWYLTSAIAVAWTVATIGAGRLWGACSDSLRRPPLFALILVLAASLAGVLLWSAVNSHVHLAPVISAVGFVVTLGLLLVVAFLLTSAPRAGRRLAVLLAVVSVGGLVSPLAVVAAERVFPVANEPASDTMTEVTGSQSGGTASPALPPLTPAEMARAAGELVAVSHPGDIAAITSPDLVAVLIASGTRPYVSMDLDALAAGPQGTVEEFARRSGLVAGAVSAHDDAPLCAAGVRWIVDRDETSVSVRATDC